MCNPHRLGLHDGAYNINALLSRFALPHAQKSSAGYFNLSTDDTEPDALSVKVVKAASSWKPIERILRRIHAAKTALQPIPLL